MRVDLELVSMSQKPRPCGWEHGVPAATSRLAFKWVTKMKILGVVFGQDTETDNWRPKLEKLEKHLNLWKSRSLSGWQIAYNQCFGN